MRSPTQQLLKILIGAAWIDGVIQPEERQYLKKVAAAAHLEEDPEIQVLLSELKPVSAGECYQWLQEYCGDHPQEADYQELLETLSGLLYSDGDIQTQEAKLLSAVQTLDPALEATQTPLEKFLSQVRRLYANLIKE
ncbi:MAG: TerB family tellurite resistance protein [Cyanobacteria bacterium RI_101]|nr:TerB family tellurite resistance protein [Cyanobacteria bacterium RI_101]